MKPKNNNEFHFKLNIIVFVLVIFVGGFLFFLIPKKAISENEQRKLSKFPKFSSKSFFSGNYTDSIDLYYADNFVFREKFLTFVEEMKNKYGFQNKKLAVYHSKNTAELDEEQIIEDDLIDSVANKSDTLTVMVKNDTLKSKKSVNEKVISYDRAIFVYKNKAFQLYCGSRKRMQKFAELVNLYQKVLSPRTQIHCLAIPQLHKYFLPEKNWANSEREKNEIDYLYLKLAYGVKSVKVYQEIEKHKGEYMYFNTDHHWTGLGAYYAYRAFCSSAGFTPYELSDFETKAIKPFYGRLYNLTLSPELKQNPDSVVYYKFPITTSIKIARRGNDFKRGRTGDLIVEYAKGVNSYSVFLGGDFPLLKVISDVKTNRKILVIKDSNGNAFAPFLSLHFSEVYVADYRYYKSNIVELIRENQITDFIFVHSTIVINRNYTVSKETNLLGKYRHIIKKNILKNDY